MDAAKRDAGPLVHDGGGYVSEVRASGNPVSGSGTVSLVAARAADGPQGYHVVSREMDTVRSDEEPVGSSEA